MKNYFKYITYFLLSTIDSFINLIFSIVYVYPRMDMSGNFLAWREVEKALAFTQPRDAKRMADLHKAEKTIEDIKKEYVEE